MPAALNRVVASVPAGFAQSVVRWQRRHGRHDLPWQRRRDPYAVWLSEIMLQQTQVATVQNYFPRFLQRFPTVRDLAAAELDDVLALWSGLGYYRRARLLHQCAQQVVAKHQARFPGSAQELEALPGIGRSTAAAIASLCFGERVAILDGNVKRVLTRVLAFAKDLAIAGNERELWSRAQDLLPRRQARQLMPEYSQGLMDLGATVCRPRQPHCRDCPLQSGCLGLASGDPLRFPHRRREIRRSSQALWLLLAINDRDETWLVKRAPTGIWAGLYCLPSFDTAEALRQAVAAGRRKSLVNGVGFVHVLTHRDLELQPVQLRVSGQRAPLADGAWVARQALTSLGLPAPVRSLLQAPLAPLAPLV